MMTYEERIEAAANHAWHAVGDKQRIEVATDIVEAFCAGDTLYVKQGTPKKVRNRQVVGGYEFVPLLPEKPSLIPIHKEAKGCACHDPMEGDT